VKRAEEQLLSAPQKLKGMPPKIKHFANYKRQNFFKSGKNGGLQVSVDVITDTIVSLAESIQSVLAERNAGKINASTLSIIILKDVGKSVGITTGVVTGFMGVTTGLQYLGSTGKFLSKALGPVAMLASIGYEVIN
jgi:hypothetical protein